MKNTIPALKNDQNIGFGANVILIDPSLSSDTIRNLLNSIYKIQKYNQFGDERCAVMFKPGKYKLDLDVGFYTHIIGLGQSPEDTQITGTLRSEGRLPDHNSLCNFWRGIENFTLIQNSAIPTWSVSQAAPFRRMNIKSDLLLHDNEGWGSGGFIADSKIEGSINSGSQQQWLSRNTNWKSWIGYSWNMVFLGVNNPPAGNWPLQAYTSVNKTPVIREKPYLYIDNNNEYQIFVPNLNDNQIGPTWCTKNTTGESIPFSNFYKATPEKDTVATINEALKKGMHLFFNPGIYHFSEAIEINRAGTIVLGIGFPSIINDNGNIAMKVADVDGIKICGILFDAGSINSRVLLEIGPEHSSKNHAADPICLYDLYFRVGGVRIGKTDTHIIINSNDVIGDHFWAWRADHGENNSVGWDVNTADYGIIVNGNNVTIYGLFVEHFQKYQTLWNGNYGRTYFYQSELPYDIPDQDNWMSANKTINGYPSYKVADTVTHHEAWGLGIYSVFHKNDISLNSAIEAPEVENVHFHHIVTCSLGQTNCKTNSTIDHIINDYVDGVGPDNFMARLGEL